MSTINVKLETFEGPFDLLFHLIEKNEIDIYDIPISNLTEQYLEHIKLFQNRDMDNISEFMLMAATLIEIKSKMLLPLMKENAEKDMDPREDLVNRLIEYKRFKRIAWSLKQIETEAEQVVYRKPEKNLMDQLAKLNHPELSEMLEDVTLNKLFSIFEDVLKRKELKVDKIRSGFKGIQKDLYSISDKIEHIRNLLVISKRILFSDIFKESTSKTEKIVTFLAMLELIKTKHIQVTQDKIFDEIYIEERYNNEVE